MGGLGQSIKNDLLKDQPHVVLTFHENFSHLHTKKQENLLVDTLKKHSLADKVSNLYFFETVDLIIKTQDGAFTGVEARGYTRGYLNQLNQKTKLPKIEWEKSEKQPSPDQPVKKNNSPIEFNEKKMGTNTLYSAEINPSLLNLKKTIIIPAALADELNLFHWKHVDLIPAENLLLPPGEPVHFERASVKNIIYPETLSMNQKNFILYDRAHFPQFSRTSSYVYGFKLKLKNPDLYARFKTALLPVFKDIETWPERHSLVFYALKIEKTLMSILLSLAGFITLLSISSLLVLLMIQKKADISILMVFGLSASHIKSLFTQIGLLLCLTGCLGGVLLGLALCLFIRYVDLSFISQYFSMLGSFPVDISWSFIGVLIAATLACALLSCLFSACLQNLKTPAELIKSLKP